jgi:replicative DNA helicase
MFADEQLERWVLGAVIADGQAMHELAAVLLPRHFSTSAHIRLWEAMLVLYERSQPIDYATLKVELADDLESVGGLKYIGGLDVGMPRSSGSATWAGEIISKARRRYALAFAQRFVEELNGDSETEDVIERFQDQLTRLQASRRDGVIAVRDVVPQSIQWLNDFSSSSDAMLGIPCGLPDVDRMLLGWQKGALYVIAARPSRGKSVFCSQASVYAALRDYRVLYIGMEMRPKATTVRMLCAEAGVDRWDLRQRRGQELKFADAWQRVSIAAGRLMKANIHFDQREQPTIAQIRAIAKQHQAGKGLDLVVVDYMQRCGKPKGVDDWQNVGDVAVGLKSLAQALDVPVIAACLLGTQAEEKRPTQDNLAQAKQRISAEADVIVFLHPEDPKEWRKHDYPNVLFIVDKQRDGATGEIKLSFERTHNRFVQMVESEPPQKATA